MAATSFTVEATLEPDGVTLRLGKKLSLPTGRVIVTVQPAGPSGGPTMLEVLDRIHREQQHGRKPMTEEEMAAEIAGLRAEDDDYEERWREIWSQTGDAKNSDDGVDDT